jgi:YihY family inner membrane protein
MAFTNILHKIDSWQRKNRVAGFVLAVGKKYSDDQTGYLAAILTYYGFLAIFPLMLVTTTVIKQLLPVGSQFRNKLITNLSAHVPIIGSQLSSNVHGLRHSGLALFVAILLTIYGMRGIANATQYSLNHIWLVQKAKRPHFPHNTLKSMAIVVVVGVGFLGTGAMSSYISALGHSLLTRIVTVLVSLVILALTLQATFVIGTAKTQKHRQVFRVASLAAIGLEILQLIGGYIIINELKHLTSLYGLFAAVLGLIFWLYLMAQVVLCAIEAGSVSDMKLWPRGIGPLSQTPQDEIAIDKYRQRCGL